MPRTPVIRDVNHPDFPHGTPKGRHRGCACTDCRAAKQRRNKQLTSLRNRGINSKTIGEPKVAAVLTHVDNCLAIPGVTEAHLAKVAGVSQNTIARARQTLRLSGRSAARIMAVKPADLAGRHRVDPAPYVLMVRQMQALGYGLRWQEKHSVAGLHQMISIVGRGEQNLIDRRVADAIAALARKVGDKPAEPGPGLTPMSIATTRHMARRAGYYPPAYYDEDGTLDYRALPEHPWTIIEEACHDKLDRLALALRNPTLGGRALTTQVLGPQPQEDTPEHTAWDTMERNFTRMLKRLGIRQIDAEGPARRVELAELLWKFRNGDGNPVEVCIDLGLLDPSAAVIPNDHPAVAEERAQQREDRLAAKRALSAAAREAAKAAAPARAAA
jgi:hypothetical protein